MSEVEFEFVVEGPAVSFRANHKNATRYQKWIQTVRRAAQAEWPQEATPVVNPVSVTISNYFTLEPPDVDNIIKPILDALNVLVYEDDRQVFRVTSQKFDRSAADFDVPDATPALTRGLKEYTELLHIVVVWIVEEPNDSNPDTNPA